MKITISNYQLRVYFSRLEKRTGVCSQKFGEADSHMLLWDFDNANLSDISNSLYKIQRRYKLPPIYIIQSSPENYHAYCFASRSFREVISILSSTPEIDENYLRLGVVRGYYTLRITPRANEFFHTVKTLFSVNPQEMEYNDITTNEYLTSNKGGHNA